MNTTLNNVHCFEEICRQSENKSICIQNPRAQCVSVYVRTCLCAYVDECVAEHMYVCNDKTETRDALKLLVPSDETESSSDRFHLPCLNLNLQGCGTSNSLRTNGICQPTSKCFSISFSPVTKGFKRASTQAGKYEAFVEKPAFTLEFQKFFKEFTN